jgi:8-oxo-dGTP pyrophosphatase MutT (NUDIX family)
MGFAAGRHVFPGGGVDGRDADRAIPWAKPPPAEWCGQLAADPPLVRALVCAAVRETFEESGVLLAGPAGAGGLLSDVSGADWEADRRALVRRSLAFADFLRDRGLALRADLIVPWAHWITPAVEPKRFSTRFFLAALPAGQQARHVGGEADCSAWLGVRQALAAFQRRELAMMPPTAAVLRELAAYSDVGSALAAACAREIRAVLPKVALDADDAHHAYLLLPGDDGYAGPARP